VYKRLFTRYSALYEAASIQPPMQRFDVRRQLSESGGSGCNVLVVGPRESGKTTLLRDIVDQCMSVAAAATDIVVFVDLDDVIEWQRWEINVKQSPLPPPSVISIVGVRYHACMTEAFERVAAMAEQSDRTIIVAFDSIFFHDFLDVKLFRDIAFKRRGKRGLTLIAAALQHDVVLGDASLCDRFDYLMISQHCRIRHMREMYASCFVDSDAALCDLTRGVIYCARQSCYTFAALDQRDYSHVEKLKPTYDRVFWYRATLPPSAE